MARGRGDAGATPVWDRAAGSSLVRLLGFEPGRFAARHCVWHTGRLAVASPDLDAAAWLVADEMMKGRCGAARRTYDLWRARATGGPPLTTTEREMVETFVEPSIGLPTDPTPRDPDHLQGAVAEYVWYLAARDWADEGRTIRYIEKPSLFATEAGGDGLVVYRLTTDGSLIFRLWEIKKYTGSGSISRVISNACAQLAARGKSYFAKYASLGEQLPDDELVNLYGELGERWITAHATAGAGVAVATSESKVPSKAFSQMHRHLPGLNRGAQLEGIVSGIGDFASFAEQVRRFLWTGL